VWGGVGGGVGGGGGGGGGGVEPGMAVMFDPGGSIILPWTVQGTAFEGDCPRRDSPIVHTLSILFLGETVFEGQQICSNIITR